MFEQLLVLHPSSCSSHCSVLLQSSVVSQALLFLGSFEFLWELRRLLPHSDLFKSAVTSHTHPHTPHQGG